MGKQIPNPEQLQLGFDTVVASDLREAAIASNVVRVEFARPKSSLTSEDATSTVSRSDVSILDQVLERARRLNW